MSNWRGRKRGKEGGRKEGGNPVLKLQALKTRTEQS